MISIAAATRPSALGMSDPVMEFLEILRSQEFPNITKGTKGVNVANIEKRMNWVKGTKGTNGGKGDKRDKGDGEKR